MKASSPKNMARDVVSFYDTTSKLALVGSILGLGFIGVNPANAISIGFVPSNPITTPDFATEFTPLPTGSGFPYPTTPFDGFSMQQVNGEPNDLWTTYNPGGGDGKGWYPSGGDFGYTQIALQSGQKFDSASLFVGSGIGVSPLFLAYELLDNSTSVASGVLSGHTRPLQWLSITGGGFDTIRLRDGLNSSISFLDGNTNALAFDKINATVGQTSQPVPEPFTIIGTLIGGTAALRMRRKLKATAN